MTRGRVDDRARRIYEFLKANLNRPFLIGDLLAAVDLHDSQTTRAAIRRARGFAADDGLCFPVACPANGKTYCVTDEPSVVVDPALHLGAIAIGVGVRKDVHDEFMRERMSKLSPAERALVHVLEKWGATERAHRQVQGEFLTAMVAMRHEGRRQADDA